MWPPARRPQRQVRTFAHSAARSVARAASPLLTVTADDRPFQEQASAAAPRLLGHMDAAEPQAATAPAQAARY